jgi:hypothetical protein
LKYDRVKEELLFVEPLKTVMFNVFTSELSSPPACNQSPHFPGQPYSTLASLPPMERGRDRNRFSLNKCITNWCNKRMQ